jgi:uncharacterized lipoprotein YmbA
VAPVRRAAAALGAVLAIGACASSPVTLVALPPAPAVSAEAGPGASVMLREVSVPGYLDGFPVLLGRDGDALVYSRNTEWAERLSLGAARVLRDVMSQRLGTSRMIIAGDGRSPDADLTVEFFALDPQGAVVQLDARWFFSCAGGGGRGGRTRLRVPMAAATPGAVAAATGEALAQFGDVLAAELPCQADARASSRDQKQTFPLRLRGRMRIG